MYNEMSNQCLRTNDRLILIVVQNIELARHHFWSTAQYIHKFNDYSVVNPRFPQKGLGSNFYPGVREWYKQTPKWILDISLIKIYHCKRINWIVSNFNFLKCTTNNWDLTKNIPLCVTAGYKIFSQSSRYVCRTALSLLSKGQVFLPQMTFHFEKKGLNPTF